MRSLLSIATGAYLALPVVIFLIAYAPTAISVAAAIALMAALAMVLKRTDEAPQTHVRWPDLTMASVLAGALVWLSGAAGGGVPKPDWDKHLAVLAAVADAEWPVRLAGNAGASLRYYVGLYLVPGGAGQLGAEADAVRLALAMWIFVGLVLGFLWVTAAVPGRYRWMAIPLTVLVGSLDWLGAGLVRGEPFSLALADPGTYMPWAGDTLVPSLLPSVLWTPQHLIPAMIIGGVFACTWRDRARLDGLLAVSALSILWSPFAAVAGLILAALCLARGHRSVGKSTVAVLLLLAPAAVAMVAFLMGGDAPITLTTLNAGQWALLLIAGVSLPVVAALLGPRRWLAATAGITAALCMIPLLRLGVINDFAARTSLPLLVALWLIAVRSGSVALRALRMPHIGTALRRRATGIVAVIVGAVLLAIPPAIGTISTSLTDTTPTWADNPRPLAVFLEGASPDIRAQYAGCPGPVALWVLSLPACRPTTVIGESDGD